MLGEARRADGFRKWSSVSSAERMRLLKTEQGQRRKARAVLQAGGNYIPV